MSDPLHEKLLKIREKQDFQLKPVPRLRSTIVKPDGSEVPLQMRSYQAQMVAHMLMRTRFVCGDDVGLGKCCAAGHLIATSRGLVPIENMHNWSKMNPETFETIDREWHVLFDGEALPVKNFYYGGKKPTIKMRTRYNFELEGSLVHPVRVWRGGTHQWVQMADLQVGDYICVERREISFPNEDLNLNQSNRSALAKGLRLPHKMSTSLARWLGYLVAEGWFNHKYSLSISQCPEKNPEIHDDICDLTKTLFGYQLSSDSMDKYIHSAAIIQFLQGNGLFFGVAKDKKVPECILQSSREMVVAFLRALFEGDGGVTLGGIEYSTASEDLSRQLQIMLLQFGIVARRSPKRVRGYEQTYWRLTIFGKDAHIFQEKIGFVSTRKREALAKVLDRSLNPNHDVVPNCSHIIEGLRQHLKLAVTKGGSNSNRKGSGLHQFGIPFVKALQSIRNGGNPAYRFLSHFLEICRAHGLENTDDYEALLAITQSHYFYDPVTSLEESESEVFDIEVDDPRHSFVANGIVNHNTLEAIATMAYIWAKEPDIIPIIVTTKSAILQWGSEIEKFSNGVSWVAVDGTQAKREKTYQAFFEKWDQDKPMALITNYHRLVRDHRVLEKHLEGKKFMIFMDEATAFKNLKSQTHKICKKFAHMATRAYGMTATLIKNNLEEGFGIFQVLCPGVFASHNAFLSNYCVTRMQPLPGTKRKIKMLVGHSKDHVALFKAKIEPYYLGRAKHDVARELPILTMREIRVPVSQSQWEYYHEALSGILTLNQGTENEEERETTKLTQLIYCQQIVNDPYLIGNEGESEKLNTLLELLDSDLAGKKILVFSRFKGMVDRIQDVLIEMGYTYAVDKIASRTYEPKREVKLGFARITGDESSEERAAGRVAFMETEGTNLMFLTMAGAEAVNLQEAEVMIFFDLPWSAGDLIQLLGRMIRIGSPHQNVYAINLIATGPHGQSTIDGHVATTVNKKMGFIEGALGERLMSQGMDTTSSPTQDIFDMVFKDARDMFSKGGQ